MASKKKLRKKIKALKKRVKLLESSDGFVFEFGRWVQPGREPFTLCGALEDLDWERF